MSRATRYLRDKLAASDPHCTCCGVFLIDEHQRTLDHVVPLSRGGTDRQENAALACGRCNQFKGALTVDEFRLLLAWMLERLTRMQRVVQ